MQGVLRGHHYRASILDDGTLHLYADRFRWVPFASLIGHLSLVLILAGAIVGSTFGYRDSQFTIAEGATLPVAAEPGLTIKLIDFTDTYYATTGAPRTTRARSSCTRTAPRSTATRSGSTTRSSTGTPPSTRRSSGPRP